MATHSSILVWRIPWTEKPGGIQPTGLQRVKHDGATNTFTFTLYPLYIKSNHLITQIYTDTDAYIQYPFNGQLLLRRHAFMQEQNNNHCTYMGPQGSQKPKVQSDNKILDYDSFVFAHLQRFLGHCEATTTPRIRNMNVAGLGDSSLLSLVSPSLSFYFTILNFTRYSIPSPSHLFSIPKSLCILKYLIVSK